MPFDPDHLIALPPRVTNHRFTRRDTILYALGVGAGQGAQADDLQFVYEEGLQALPTMAVMLAYPGFWQREPEYGIDWKRVLHAEQSVTFERPLPVEGEVRGELTIDGIIDKGLEKGALLYSTRRIYNAEDNDLLATARQVSFLRGDGGQGGASGPAAEPHRIPDRPADMVLLVPTRPEQALLYRLSGDHNPLHADPRAAREAGLPRPILHGLCSYGIAGRSLLAQLCGHDPDGMKRLDARFTAPIFPGDELSISVWNEDRGRAAYRVDVPSRSVTVINNGYMEYLP